MKIALAQLNYHIGNFDGNVQKMMRSIREAESMGADLVVFGELAVCGYPPRDFLEFGDFIRRCHECILQLCRESHRVGIIVGAPTVNPVIEGKDLFNSVYLLHEGEVRFVQHKSLLPTYDIFDEYRYFEPASEHRTALFKGKRIAFTVCEDIWNVGNENPLYTICPLDEMMAHKPDLIINVSASPFSYDQARARIHTVRANVMRYGLPMFYCNHVGAQTDIIFDGGSLVMSPDGAVYAELPYFREHLEVFDLEDVVRGGRQQEQEKDKTALIHDALLTGIRDYFGKLGFRKAILGLSGGIDSAVTAVLAARALGPENVRALLMPSQYSSDHSVADARALAENLGIAYDILPIQPAYDALLGSLEPFFEGMPFNIAEENIQARVRGLLLMAMSNKFGHILLNTSNKSEAAVGYGTLYGDMCGGIAVLGDVYKTAVYALAQHINRDGVVIPLNSIQKPPSAELRPGQKDSDSLPPYEVLDPILYQYIEMRQGPRDIEAMGYDPALVARILRLVNINEFKREQSAPVLRVSPKAFGMGRRMPIVGKYLNEHAGA